MFLVAVAWIGAVLPALRIPLAIDGVLIIVVTAVALDVCAEWRARREHGHLVPAWPIHQVSRLDAALTSLTAAGIAVHPRAANHRALFHFFAPHLAIDLLVPPARVAEAQTLLEQRTV